MKKRLAHVILLALTMTLISGCLLTRLHQTQKQVCSKKTRLEMTKEGLQIVFDQPLLMKEDVVAILGAKTGSKDPDRHLVYIARNKNDEAFSFPVVFGFHNDGKEYTLTKVSLGKRFQDFLPEELLLKLFIAGCSAKRKGLGIEVDLSGVPVDLLPRLDLLRKVLGMPARADKMTAVYNYEFNRDAIAEIKFLYEDDKFKSASVLFQSYSLVFDFDERLATGKINNFSDAVRLGFRP